MNDSIQPWHIMGGLTKYPLKISGFPSTVIKAPHRLGGLTTTPTKKWDVESKWYSRSILGITSQTHHNGRPLRVTWCDVFMTSVLKNDWYQPSSQGKHKKKGLGSTTWTENFCKILSCQTIWHHKFCRKKRMWGEFFATWTFNLSVFCPTYFNMSKGIITSGDKENKKPFGMSFLETFPTHSWHTHTLLAELLVGILQHPNRWRHSDMHLQPVPTGLTYQWL